MTDKFKFDNNNPDTAIEFAKGFAAEHYTAEMETVIKIAFKDFRNLPSLRFKEDEVVVLKDYMQKWVNAFLKGYNNRPSVKVGQKSATYSDKIISIILQARLPKIDDKLAAQLEGGHALMMTIENLVGEFLEEYLSEKLKTNGWCCCWGSTIDAVDFCKEDGELIQIKNSSNSENSSSSRVRAGTSIGKWFRRKSTKADAFSWDELNQKVGRDDLSEEDFRKFVAETIRKNPECLFIDEDHTLISI